MGKRNEKRDEITRILRWGKEDYYEILDVEQDASNQEIKRQWNKKSKILHPDKNPDVDSTKVFRRLKRAFDVLSNPEERRKYDEKRERDGAPEEGDLGEDFASGASGSESEAIDDIEDSLSYEQQGIIDRARPVVEELLNGNEELVAECEKINERMIEQNQAEGKSSRCPILPTNFLLKMSRDRQSLLKYLKDNDPDKEKRALKKLEQKKEKLRDHLRSCQLPITWTFTIPDPDAMDLDDKSMSDSMSDSTSDSKSDSTSDSPFGQLLASYEILGHRSILSTTSREQGTHKAVAVETPVDFIVKQTKNLNRIAIVSPGEIFESSINEYFESDRVTDINGIDKRVSRKDANKIERVLGIARKYSIDDPDKISLMVLLVKLIDGKEILINKSAFINAKGRGPAQKAIDRFLEAVRPRRPMLQNGGFGKRLQAVRGQVYTSDSDSDGDMYWTSNDVKSRRRQGAKYRDTRTNARYKTRSDARHKTRFIGGPNDSDDAEDVLRNMQRQIDELESRFDQMGVLPAKRRRNLF